jgi:serine/threonine protein kinase
VGGGCQSAEDEVARRPSKIREHQAGSALLFRHDHRDLTLDAYLDVHGAALTPETRLDLVRQLAEAVRYAHNRSLYHRALAARSIYVSVTNDTPTLRIIDWQTAARDFDTATPKSIGHSSVDGDLVEDAAQVYLAPEFDLPYADPVDLDVFGIGAVAYLILTGRPPAPTGRPSSTRSPTRAACTPTRSWTVSASASTSSCSTQGACRRGM